MRQRSGRLAVYGMQLINSVRGGVIGPLMPLFIYQLSHGSFTLASLAGSVSTLLSAVLAPLAGALVDRVGKRKVVIVASGLTGVATSYAASLVDDYRQYIAVSLAGSAVGLAGGIALSSLLADIFRREERGKMLGLYGFLSTAGSLTGNLLSAQAYSLFGLRGSIQLVSACGVMPVLLALLLDEEGGRRTARGWGLWTALRDRDLLRLLALNAVMRTPQAMSGSLLAVYFVKELGGGVAGWSRLAAAATAASLTYPLYGYVVDRVGRLRVVCGAAASWAVLYAGYYMSRDPATFALFYVIPVGNAYQLAITAMLYDVTDGRERGRLLGAFSSISSTYLFAATLLGGFLADSLGVRAVFAIGSITYAAAALLIPLIAAHSHSRLKMRQQAPPRSGA
ncbi:MAG: hypothetical protein DRJ57_01815 [Thermoprotei archaeon]|nr:MAG: hypothetical protein DRJ57_01815 [Thermoprotei archaeon]